MEPQYQLSGGYWRTVQVVMAWNNGGGFRINLIPSVFFISWAEFSLKSVVVLSVEEC